MLALVKTKMLIPGVIEQFQIIMDHENKRPPMSQTYILEVMKKTHLFCNHVYLAYNLRIFNRWLFNLGLKLVNNVGMLKAGDREKVVALTESD